ncbi:hypothetical protein Peur_072217 [Populus x canadensis]
MRDLKTYLSVASVISTLWFGSLAGLLIEINRFFLDVLTFPFSFWKIQERNNQPIDIGRPKGFFQCIISGSNEIHRQRFTSMERMIHSDRHESPTPLNCQNLKEVDFSSVQRDKM